LKVQAEFVTSAAGASGFPTDGLPEIALIGRSNVGKSSLINALTAQRIARTSAAPGKTRLANFYRVARGSAPAQYLVDLPGYGYARASRHVRGGPSGVEGRRHQAMGEFDELVRMYFSRGQEEPACPADMGALLLIDARHPGLDNDRAAWQWLQQVVAHTPIVATKVDKLPRGQRIRAVRELESVFEDSVLPCSAVTGEGLDDLWNLIERLANSRNPQPRRSRNSRNSSRLPPKATAARPPTK